MNDKQKAQAFDLIASGAATGMSLFWSRYDKIRKLAKEEGEGQVLRSMAKLAAEEAAQAVLDGEA